MGVCSGMENARLSCPKDGTPMEVEPVGKYLPGGGVEVDRCPKCGALWLDKGEIEKLLAMKAAKAADIGPFRQDRDVPVATELLCPRDGTPLEQRSDATQPHVRVMACETCEGRLLDAGELLDLSELTLLERVRGMLGL